MLRGRLPHPAAILLAVALANLSPCPIASELSEQFDSRSPEQQAIELLHKYAEAIGGLERIREVKSISSLAEIELRRGDDIHGRPFTIIDSVVEVYPDKRISYTSLVGEAPAMISVLNGEDGFWIRDGKVEKQSEDHIAESRAGLRASTIPILSAIDDPYYEVTYAGEESIAGRDFLKLDFTLPDKQAWSWYLDPETYLVYAEHDYFGDSPGFIFIGDYEEFDGLMIPVSAAFQGAEGSMKFTLYWLEINAPYDSTAFERPAD